MNVGIQALYDAMKAVHEGTPASQLPGAASKEVMAVVSASRDHDAWTRAYLSGKG